MTRFLRRLHLVLALAGAVFVLNLSISGALLVFGKELEALWAPAQWTVQPGEARLPLNRLNAGVAQSTGALPTRWLLAQANDEPWRATLADGSWVNVDPYTGRVLLHYDYTNSPYGLVLYWHRWLLWTTPAGDRPLRDLVSGISVLMMVNLLVGLWLWGKPRARLRRLRVRFGSNYKTWLPQLHNLLGVLSVLPLILLVLSGVAFNWAAPIRTVVEALSLSTVDSPVAPKQRVATVDDYDLDGAIARVSGALPTAQIHRVHLPAGPGEPLRLRLKMPGESHPYSWAWLDPADNRLLATFNAADTSLATAIWHFKYKFHIGDFAHPLVRWLWLILALVPGVFVVSGVWLYLVRRQKGRQRRAAASGRRPKAVI